MTACSDRREQLDGSSWTAIVGHGSWTGAVKPKGTACCLETVRKASWEVEKRGALFTVLSLWCVISASGPSPTRPSPTCTMQALAHAHSGEGYDRRHQHITDITDFTDRDTNFRERQRYRLSGIRTITKEGSTWLRKESSISIKGIESQRI